MDNNIRRIDKSLRSLSKRNKSIKYTPELLFSYLLMGTVAFSAGTGVASDISLAELKKEGLNITQSIRTSMEYRKIQERKELKDSSFIYLAEKDSKAKSPWNSWQVGLDLSDNSWSGIYNIGEVGNEYPLERVLTGSGDIFDRYALLINSNYTTLSRNRNLFSANSDKEIGYSYGLAQDEIVIDPLIPVTVTDENIRAELEKEAYEGAMSRLRESEKLMFKEFVSSILKEEFTTLSNNKNLIVMSTDQKTDFGIGLVSNEIVSDSSSVNESGTGVATSSLESLNREIEKLDSNIDTSINDIREAFKLAKKENSRLIKNSNIELIQLMEQGDQVIKSPWSSWQFGMNTFLTESRGTYKGRGDKAEKYPFNGIYSRDNWSKTSVLSASRKGITSSGETYSNVGKLNYGLAGLLHIREPEVEIQIMANVRPKTVFKEEINIAPTIDMPKQIVKPAVTLNVNKPIEATEIIFPKVEPVEINVTPPTNPAEPKLASAPNIAINLPTPKINVGINEPSLSMNITAPETPTISLSINPPSVTKVEAIEVTAPSAVSVTKPEFAPVVPVDFSIGAAGESNDSSIYFHGGSSTNFVTYNENLNGTLKTVTSDGDPNSNGYPRGNWFSSWGYVKNLGDVKLNVLVNGTNSRAFDIDEGIDSANTDYKPFTYNGTITLNNAKTVGIDVQGTHTDYTSGSKVNKGTAYNDINEVANVKIINGKDGKIIGNAVSTLNNITSPLKNQVGFGFNNNDKSSNNTRNEIINNGTITIGAIESAGIQLKPENSSYNNDKTTGLNMMAGRNEGGTINVNGYGSYGITTVKNPKQTKDFTYTNYKENSSSAGTVVKTGGKFASTKDSAYESKIENSGTIEVNSDSSIGIGLIHNIQGVYNTSTGVINIGKVNPTTLTNSNSDKTGTVISTAGKIDGAVGVYSKVQTTYVNTGEYDDYARENKGTMVGTDGADVDGTINIGQYATKSAGIRVQEEGSAKLKGQINIETGAVQNYGVVVEGNNYKRTSRDGKNSGKGTEQDKVGRVDIEKDSSINVNGDNSIGYVLLQGEGTNAGTITVNSESSLGFYGNKGIFENSGMIVTTGIGSNAVVLQNNGSAGATATQTLTFNNRDGKIKANTEGTVGIYAESGSTFTHEGSAAKITAGNGAIGIYTKGTGTTGTISSEIEVTGSTANKTGIAIYSDGNSTTTFTSYTPSGSTPPLASDPKLTLGEGTVGLYSEDASKFESTFVINKLEANIGDKAAFAYFGGNGKTATITRSTLNNLTVTKMGKQSTLFYGDAGTTVEIKENLDTTTKFSNVSDTAQLLVTNNGTANVETGKTINSNMKTTLSGLSGATVNNKGTLALSGKAGALGVYLDASTINNDGKITAAENDSVAIYGEKNSTLLNNSEIETSGASSVGMFANNSNVTNKTGASKITTNGAASAGIYGANNSVISNEGLITTKNNDSAGIYADTSNAENTGTITNEKGGSAGIYAKTSVDKDISNKGTINVGTSGSSEIKGAGIYAELAAGGAGPLNISNEGDINVEIQNSVGVYAKNGTSAKADVVVTNSKNITSSGDKTVGILAETATVTNAATTGKIELKGTGSVGIFGKSNSGITNDGKILSLNTSATSASVGILSDSGSAKNTGEITIDGGASAGIIGKNGATILNDASGKINMKNTASAGIYTENTNSTNKGNINITGASSAGMYAKNSGTGNFDIVNEGNIELATTGTDKQSVGMYAHLVTGTTGTTKLENSNTTGKIKINQENSVGMYVKNESTSNTLGKAENSGEIEANKKNGVGIFVEKATGTNTSTGKITLAENGSAGIYGKADSVIENLGEITVKKDSSAGMYALNSESKNSSTINVEEGESAGMYAKLTKAAIKDYTSTNNGTINLTANGIKKKSAGMYGEIETGATKKLTLSNEKDINIGIEESVGILSINNTGVEKLVVSNSGNITGTKDSSVGISAEKSTVTNTGNIVMTGLKSAGIYGKKNSEITNSNVISISEDTSAGIYLEDSDAVNSTGGKITVDKKGSSGIYGKYTDSVAHEIINEGEVTLTAASGETQSAGIYGQLEATSTGNLTINNITINNKGTVEVGMEESVGIYAKKISGAAGTLTAENNKDVNVKSNKSVGIFADNSNGINNKNITVDGQEATGIFGTEGATITNSTGGTIVLNSTANKSSGMFATKAGTTGVNEGTIELKATETNGMVATAGSKVTNKNTITGEISKVIGMYGTDSGTNVVNEKTITLKGDDSTAIFTKDDAKGLNETTGIIDINGIKSVGMFGLSSAASKKIDLENKGTINVNKETSTGIFASNSGALTDSVIKNAGTINLKDTKTVGIYTPNSTISAVGTINFDTNANSSVAVYLSDGAKADASTGIIDLNNNSQNKVAYYIKDNGELEGANIGTVKGYGVGVYLDNANLAATTPTLDYTTNGNSGDGLIGLLMKGTNANIASYSKGIKVGATTGTNYAIGIYTDAQGTAGSAKGIAANVTTGANGIGIFAENGSNITYTGTMNIGDGTTAGTGVYIGNNKGANPSTFTLDSGSKIKLNGVNGVGVIATTGSTINFESGSEIELGGAGVGIYGQYGAHINDRGGTFTTNGHSAERIRLTEGQITTGGNLTLETGNVLSHVISGEASISPGIVVDAKPNSNSIIGILADGNKNPVPPAALGITWVDPVYEAVNSGTLDLSNATKSTGIYVDSARGKNSGTLILGDNSTAMYGIYKPTTGTYSEAPAGYINKTELLNDSGSTIKIGNSSAAMYGIALDKVENKGTITGGNESVGIYATDRNPLRNENLNIQNSGNITLGNGSAGIYVQQTSPTNNPTVNHSGAITVGDSVLDSAGNVVNTSVGMFVENRAVLTATGDVTVGNKGFALYGNNGSTINVNGGNYNFSNNGSLAYLGGNTTLNYNNSGTLTTSSEPMLYIIDSKANMNNNDIVVSAGGTGVYMNGTSSFSGWNTMTLNKASTGIYVDSSSATIAGQEIKGISDKAKGIVAVNSNIVNSTGMKFSDNDSIGIFSRNTSSSPKNIVNSGNIDIKGERSIAIYMEGTSDQTLLNTGTINVEKTSASNKDDSTVGIYAKGGSKIDITNSGAINTGEASFGIYSLSTQGNVTTTGSSTINVADKAIGIYKKGGTVNLGGTVNVADHTATAKNSEPVGLFVSGGAKVTDTTSSFNVGDKAYGVILSNPVNENTYSNSASSNVFLGKDSTFIYAEGASKVNNKAGINSGTNGGIIAIYGKDGAKVENSGIIDLSQGIGNQGILVTGTGSSAENKGVIKVGKTDKSDPKNIIYGIGMAAINNASITNSKDIYVSGNSSIGMYGDGSKVTLKNTVLGNIYLDASSATATDKIQTMMGVFVNNGATFINDGTIKTAHSYSGNSNVQGLVGVAVLNGSTLINNGTIDIDARDSYGVLIKGTQNNKSIIKNYGNIIIRGLGSYGVRYDANSQGTSGDLPVGSAAVPSAVLPALNNGVQGNIASAGGAEDYYAPKDPSKNLGGVGIITMPDGKLAIKRDGVVLQDSELTVINHQVVPNFGFSNFGVYVDTLGRTKPINVDGATSLGINSDLIIGTEFSVLTNSKNVVIGDQILQPFLSQISSGIFNFTPYSASLTWMATPEVDPVTQQITRVLMTKIPYTVFVPSTSNEYNFTDGLEQRYGVEGLGTREKLLFDKLNSIKNNEEVLLAQAYDEMMGHQYANTGQRVHSTGSMLDKEFTYLKKEWETKSKESNKIKIFGMRDEYNTDTAGIIDYTSDSYGVAYLHEDETIKLGDTTGWYAGIVQNRFKFKDIGGSKENSTLVKAGVFKSVPFDHNNSLNWTVYAEGFAAQNNMKRRYLVVDDIFNAESDYYAYGVAVKNEIGKEFRTSERTSIRAFGSLKLEYGRIGDIKEDTGEMRLEIQGNDYYSIKPELGVEFKFKRPVAKRSTFIATLGLGYETELGKVGDIGNKGRVRFTTADWFNIPGEKDSRSGNFKVDLNLGLENTRLGITLNGGYDTRGENFRGGIGLRAIY